MHVVVSAGRGGLGVSTTAVALAQSLGTAEQEVWLVDATPLLPATHIVAGVEPERDMLDLMPMLRAGCDASTVARYAARLGRHVALIAGPVRRRTHGAYVTGEDYRALYRALAGARVVSDVGPMWDLAPAQAALASATHVVLLVGADTPAVRGAAERLEWAARLAPGALVSVWATQATPREVKLISAALHRPVRHLALGRAPVLGGEAP